VRRLSHLAAIGIDRFIVVGPSIDSDREQARASMQTFTHEVLPAVKEVTLGVM